MSVRSEARTDWTCDVCGRVASAATSTAAEGLAWPPMPPGWTRHDRAADGAVLFACSDRCRASVAPAGTAWSSLRYEEEAGE